MELVTSQREADEILKKLMAEDAVAIDSEFHWTSTYYPIPALIQFATDEDVYLLDPLEIQDYSVLKEFLEKPDCTKILHSCEQDVLLFNNMCNAVTAPIFDSQIAYSMMNTRHQISYRGLVENLAGELLSKGSQRSNWLKRPLSETQIKYAAADVTWLLKCHKKLVHQLDTLKRTDWLRSECSLFETESFFETPKPENVYMHLRGSGRLNLDQLAIMRELCSWREKKALNVNLRPKRILPDETLFSICYKQPRNTQDLKRCKGITPMSIKFNSRDIFTCIDKALSLEDHEKPPVIEHRVPSDKEDKMCDKLYNTVKKLSEQINIAPALLMTRQTCKRIAAMHFSELPVDFSFLADWKRELFEDELNKVLSK